VTCLIVSRPAPHDSTQKTSRLELGGPPVSKIDSAGGASGSRDPIRCEKLDTKTAFCTAFRRPYLGPLDNFYAIGLMAMTRLWDTRRLSKGERIRNFTTETQRGSAPGLTTAGPWC
jgi:hypothetical protein